MVHAISLTKGYSDSDFLKFSNMTLDNSSQSGTYIDPSAEKYGISAVIEDYEETNEHGNASIAYIISYSVDLNKFNIDVSSIEPETQDTDPETNTNSSTKNDDEIENPQTGESFPYVLIFLGIIGICLLYFKKKDFIYKL